MTLREKLYAWWLKLEFKSKYEPTPKGTAILNYIADKYLNGKCEANYIIQPYEEIIKRYHNVTINFAKQLFSEENLITLVDNGQYEDFIHAFTAMFTYASIIYTFKNKQYWYDIIEDDKVKYIIEQFVRLI